MSDWVKGMKKPDKNCKHQWELAGGSITPEGEHISWFVCTKCLGEAEE